MSMYTHKHNGISGVSGGFSEPLAPNVQPYYNNRDIRQTSDVSGIGSKPQAMYGYGKLRNASSPISSLSPPQSSGNSEALSQSSLDCHYDSDSHRSDNSNPSCCSQYTEPYVYNSSAYEGACYVRAQTVRAPSLDSPCQIGSPGLLQAYFHVPSAIQCPSDPYTRNIGSGERTLKHKLQELETALMGPDGDDTDLAHVAVDGSNAPPGAWNDLLGELVRRNPQLFPVVVKEEGGGRYENLPPVVVQHSMPAILPSLQSLSMPDEQQTSFCHPSPEALPMMYQGRSVKDLLVMCAAAYADDRLDLAESIMGELRKVVSIYGDPIERLAAYMSEGLVARLESSGSSLYKALKCVEAPAADVLSAMQKMYEICPYFKFAYMAANGAIAEAFKDEAKVHIFDFQIAQGTQWFTLIQALAKRPGGPPSVRITTVDDPQSQAAPVGGMQMVQEKLGKLAESLGIKFEFQAVQARMSEVRAHMIERRSDEALAVNFALQLHHMPDESVSLTNPRDTLLRMVKSLNPKVVTLVEQEANTNTAPFLLRFMETLDYYYAVFDSIDVTLPRESKDRVNVEQQCLARDIVNVIACEGSERVERHELMGKWRARMMMAGFKPHHLSSHVNSTISMLLQSYSENYRLKEEGGALFLGWLSRSLVVASAWN